MSYEQVRFVQPDTNNDPDTGGTNGSTSIEVNGPRVRSAAASRATGLTQPRLDNPWSPGRSSLGNEGVVSGAGRSTTYGALLGDKLFNIPFRLRRQPRTGDRQGGQSVQDRRHPCSTFRHPGQSQWDVHVYPQRQSAWNAPRPGRPASGPGRVRSVGQGALRRCQLNQAHPNAQVVRQGDFIGVVAPTEYAAVQAAARLKVEWQSTATLPSNGNLSASMRAIQTTDVVRSQRGDVNSGFSKPATVLSATYKGPYQMHGTIGPAAAIAKINSQGGIVLCNTNYGYRMRNKVADTLKIGPVEDSSAVLRRVKQLRALPLMTIRPKRRH